MSEDKERPDLGSLRIDRDKRQTDRPRRKLWLLPVIIVIVAALIAGYFALRDRITPATKVKVAVAKRLDSGESQASLVATGYVVAQRKAEVASKGTGRLKYLGFEEGDKVKKDELIAELDNDDIKAALEVAKANLMRAQADFEEAERQFKRAKGLFESGSITEAEFEAKETASRLTEATVAASQASVKVAEVDLENTYIKAPFDGTVLTKNADVGEIVAPFASSSSSKGSVVTLADMNSLEVEADVSESNIYKVTVGQRCTIVLDAYPNNPYPGRVKKIVPTADRTRATVMTKVAFDNADDRVLPEMSARVNFLLKSDEQKQVSQSGLVVPKEALTSRNGQKVIFTVVNDLCESSVVTTGRDLDDRVEILSGLEAGDRVILSPPGKLADGKKVEISE